MSAERPRTLVILAAALGWNLVEKHKPATKLAFRPVAPGPLSLTCPVQATLRTALPPARHGVVASGWFHRDLARPFFWNSPPPSSTAAASGKTRAPPARPSGWRSSSKASASGSISCCRPSPSTATTAAS